MRPRSMPCLFCLKKIRICPRSAGEWPSIKPCSSKWHSSQFRGSYKSTSYRPSSSTAITRYASELSSRSASVSRGMSGSVHHRSLAVGASTVSLIRRGVDAAVVAVILCPEETHLVARMTSSLSMESRRSRYRSNDMLAVVKST